MADRLDGLLSFEGFGRSALRLPACSDWGTGLADPNPNSLTVITGLVEPGVADAVPGTRYQFERVGYFCADRDSAKGKPVYNRTVTLRDTWAKIEKAQKTGG